MRTAPPARWGPPILAAVAVALVPWTLWLTFTLPREHLAHHWRIAWVGFDAFLAVALALTAHAAWRNARYLPGLAVATATLLFCDAWFDLVTSGPGRELAESAFEAFVGEVPLALLCLWFAFRPGAARALRTFNRPLTRNAAGSN